jgi:hypothetical protein
MIKPNKTSAMPLKINKPHFYLLLFRNRIGVTARDFNNPETMRTFGQPR